jgi:nicotinamidase-related amidase
MLQSQNPALLVIDVQQAIDHFSSHPRNNPQAENRIAALLQHWRSQKLPIVHIRHASRFAESPYHADSPYFPFKSIVAPERGELVISKRENCAFIGTDLHSELQKLKVRELVITGVVTNHSVDATVKTGAALGYQIFLPEDACAAFSMQLLNGSTIDAEQVHQIFLSNLHNEYAQVCSSTDLL